MNISLCYISHSIYLRFWYNSYVHLNNQILSVYFSMNISVCYISHSIYWRFWYISYVYLTDQFLIVYFSIRFLYQCVQIISGSLCTHLLERDSTQNITEKKTIEDRKHLCIRGNKYCIHYYIIHLGKWVKCIICMSFSIRK